MSAYVIVEVAMHDPVLYEEYKKLSLPAVTAFEGKFVARGGKAFGLEGNWNPERLVIIEFPSVEKAQEWWHSPQYTEARQIREKAAQTRMLVVEGL